jgi:hypothetical protein
LKCRSKRRQQNAAYGFGRSDGDYIGLGSGSAADLGMHLLEIPQD